MVEKILVMRYRFIGDTLLTVPFLRNLRDAYPHAQIDMLVAPVSGEIIDKCPYVDNFIYFDTTKRHRYENAQALSTATGKPSAPVKSEKKTFWSYVKLLRDEKYDKAYVLKRSFSSAFLAFAAGIPERVGFDTEMRGFLLTKSLPYVEDKHEIECFLDVLKADGIEPKDAYLENWVENKELDKVKEVLAQNLIDALSIPKKVLVHATSGNRKKEWAKEKWAKIVEYLSNEKNAQVIFNGTKNDSAVYEEIMALVDCGLKIEPVNLCGKFSLRETLALTKLCDLIVGCDSGNLHIAASVDTPVIGIYGPMNTVKWKAWEPETVVLKTELPCQPCGLKKKCERDFACLKDIDVQTVKNAIDCKI